MISRRKAFDLDTLNRHELGEAIFERLKEKYEMKEAILGSHTMRLHERMVMLSVLDGLWKDHLLSMDHLKEGIGLRGYGQQDPLVAYKKESFDMFEAMMGRFQEDTVRFLFLMQIVGPDGQPITELPRRQAPEITSQSVPEPAPALPQGAPVTVEGNGSSRLLQPRRRRRPLCRSRSGRLRPPSMPWSRSFSARRSASSNKRG